MTPGLSIFTSEGLPHRTVCITQIRFMWQNVSLISFSGNHGWLYVPGKNPPTRFIYLPGERLATEKIICRRGWKQVPNCLFWGDYLYLVLWTSLIHPVFVTPAYSSEDQLLWRPGVLPVQEVEDFLLYAQRPRVQEGAACTQTQADTVPDNEQVQQFKS